MDLKQLIFVLVLYLCAGTFISLGFVKSSEVGRRYFLYHGAGLTVLLAGFYLFMGDISLTPTGHTLMVGFLVSALIYSLVAGVRPVLAWLTYLLGVAFAVGVIILDVKSRLLVGPALYITNSLLSTCLLGFSMAAMLLGHWYLVEPKLSIRELSRLSLVLIAMILLRTAFSTYFLSKTLMGKSELEIYRYLFSSTPGIFLLMRWTWGVLAPLILSVLIWNTVRIRSTQSATGILYVAVVCVLTGEIISQYLAFFHALPI